MSQESLIYYFMFAAIALVVYQIIPQRHRGKLLLLISYLFFLLASGKLVVYLLASTVCVYLIALWLSACNKRYTESKATASDKAAHKAAYTRRHRAILVLGIVANIGLLLVLKYCDFFSSNLNVVLASLSSPVVLPTLNLAVPLGISFYTLQAVSYITDVYYEKCAADRNFGRVALYMSFFPIIIEGPICRYSQTADALYRGSSLEYKNITFGVQRIVWGLFKKMVIADRLSPLVKTLFVNHEQYSGVLIIVAAMCYTFQLYMDFSGCIDVTIGTAEIFGITIPENFRQPFFSKTPAEFWRRWHITLGTWLKDYIFYPISLTKFVKNLGRKSRKRFGKHMGQVIPSAVALFGVWLCSGLWHGTGWQYIFYGMYYFVLILLGSIVEPLVQKVTAALKINRASVPYRIFQTVKMLVIIFTGEMFFRAESLQAGFAMFRSIFTGFHWSALTNGSLLRLGLSPQDFAVVLFGFIVVLGVGIVHEKGISIRARIAGWNIFFRWSFYYAAILLVIILGAYGVGYAPADVIYAGF